MFSTDRSEAVVLFFFFFRFSYGSVVVIMIIIITLFQEDNIFGTNASLTYGPQIQRHTCV